MTKLDRLKKSRDDAHAKLSTAEGVFMKALREYEAEQRAERFRESGGSSMLMQPTQPPSERITEKP